MKKVLKHIILAVLFYIVLFSAAGAVVLQQGQPTTEQLLIKAREHLVNKDYDEARLALKQLLRMNREAKEAAEANYLLALVYISRYENDKAPDYLRKATALQPIYPEAHLLLAKISFEQRDWKTAKEEIEIAWQQGCNSAEVYKLKGDLEYYSQQYETALEAYEAVLQIPADKQTEVDMEELKRRKQLSQWAIESRKRFQELSAGNEEVDEKPVPLNTPRPNYTELARQKKLSGNVRIGARIDEQGNVTHTIVLSSLDYGLDEQAIFTARAVKFKPAMKNNQAVPFWIQIEVGFALR